MTGQRKMFNGVNDIGRMDFGWPRRIHFRENGCRAHRRVKQRKQRKPGDIRRAGLDLKKLLNLGGLFKKHAMAVKHTLGRPRAAGCKNDGREILA